MRYEIDEIQARIKNKKNKEKKEFKELTDEQLEKVTGGIGLKCAEKLKALCQVPLTAACICPVM